ncbi:hypothetical protein SERLADRAFT_466083 [Serpula lacrymans var. lacrymans S7.9]|nr:uncharacterized protein SERLADRAFT_466083 [Serpula lacrymans var. lacrymans S7.9]EGO25632.1 hypothetical protein SERLADRAFT_466083 [Serpula lacrymans var. lacrymans S7.9]
MSKVAEESLKSEIEQLNAELTDTSRFQEAYLSLVEEVEGLLARNTLAEEETERLSKFNAEIIGHNNPAQRIMYVDRIRRELSETKQKLLMSMRDKDVVVAENDDLRHEIAMYKSVMVPVDSKPRTHITRVSRPPLSNQNLNVSVVELQDAGSDGCPKMTASNPPILETIDGDMTVDELS